VKIVVYGDAYRVGLLEGADVIDIEGAFIEASREAGNAHPEQTAAERLGGDLAEFIAKGTSALDAAQEAASFVRVNGPNPGYVHSLESTKLRAPWPRRRIACAGGNYADHLVRMSGAAGRDALPEAEIAKEEREKGQWGFWKVPAAVSGPGDEIPYPKRTQYLDYEGEVAIVIGKSGKDLSADKFDEYVWGVTLLNDVSIRDGVYRSTGSVAYSLPKNFDGTPAMGPVIVVNENLDPSNIDVELSINGHNRQAFNSSAMIWSFGEMAEFLSQDFTFVPGDVISGGTARGTAADSTPRPAEGEKRSPELFLRPGDEIRVESPQIGVLINRIV
jgi:acylpyruvate hydrolase